MGGGQRRGVTSEVGNAGLASGGGRPVRNNMLLCFPGIGDPGFFSRRGVEKDERALQIEREEVEQLARDRDDELAILDRNIYARLGDLILGKTAVKGPKGVKPNSEITSELLETLSRGQWWQLALAEEQDAQIVEALHEHTAMSAKAVCKSSGSRSPL